MMMRLSTGFLLLSMAWSAAALAFDRPGSRYMDVRNPAYSNDQRNPQEALAKLRDATLNRDQAKYEDVFTSGGLGRLPFGSEGFEHMLADLKAYDFSVGKIYQVEKAPQEGFYSEEYDCHGWKGVPADGKCAPLWYSDIWRVQLNGKAYASRATLQHEIELKCYYRFGFDLIQMIFKTRPEQTCFIEGMSAIDRTPR